MAYYSIEPFGEDRADFRAGVVAATIGNVHRRKGSRIFKPEDFMYFRHRQSTDEDMRLSQTIIEHFKHLPRN